MIYPAERFIALTSIVLIAIIAGLVNHKGIEIDIVSLVPSFAIASIFLVIGLFYRFVRKSDKISVTLLGLALFSTYSFLASLFSHVLLPLNGPPIDEVLVMMDAKLGFSWPQWIEFFSRHLLLNEVLRHAYKLSLATVLFAVLALGFLNSRKSLHSYLVSLTISSLIVICIWTFLPSAGASAYWTLDPQIEEMVRPVVGTEYGQKLNHLFAQGMPYVSGHNITGLIGSPSFHTVMIILPVVFTYGMRNIFPVFLIYGLVTLPSILVHGGHNLMDVIFGATIAVVAVFLTKKMISNWEASAETSEPVSGQLRPAE